MAPTTEKRLTETAIFNAIEYALRHEPVVVFCEDEAGYYDVEADDPHFLQPFVMCLLRELEVIS